jgi:hypothetical protein
MKYHLCPIVVPHNTKTQSALVNATLYGITTPVHIPRPFQVIDTFCTDASIACTLQEYRRHLIYPKHPPPKKIRVETLKWKYVVEHCPFVKPSYSPEEASSDTDVKQSAHDPASANSARPDSSANSSVNSGRIRTPLEQHFQLSDDVVNMQMADKPIIIQEN